MCVGLQVAARKLKPQVERPPSLHERILEEIKSERKLRPVSPDQIRRSRMGETANTHNHTHTHVHINILAGWPVTDCIINSIVIYSNLNKHRDEVATRDE